MRIKSAVNIPPIGSIYFDDKLSKKSKNVDPKILANPGPREEVIFTPPPREREQNTPTKVITNPNWMVAFFLDHPY